MGGVCHGEDLINGLRVRTIYVDDGYYFDEYDSEGDTGWATYIDDHFGENVIEYYGDNEDAAAQGHAKWCLYISPLNYFRRITTYDREGNLADTFRLWPINSPEALKEQARRQHAAEVSERKRKREAKRSLVKTYKHVADAFKGFPFKKIAQSSGRLGSISYHESYDYIDVSTFRDATKKYIPRRRYGSWKFIIRDASIINKYLPSFEKLAHEGWINEAQWDGVEKLRFKVTVDPWTSQKWIDQSGGTYKLEGLE
jgi:hypothetical protein